MLFKESLRIKRCHSLVHIVIDRDRHADSVAPLRAEASREDHLILDLQQLLKQEA